MLEITRETDVFTARDEHVGSVDRVVLDSVTRRMTHVVVRKGVFLPEDKLIATEDISTATRQRINLKQDVDVDGLLPFIEQFYVPVDGSDVPGAFMATWYGPIGVPTPMHEGAIRTVMERNIPERLTALEGGAAVIASDNEDVGRLERVVTTDTGLPTHIVIVKGVLPPERRAVPINWVDEIAEREIALGATRRMVEAIVPLGPGD
jgi:hypothetical protein